MWYFSVITRGISLVLFNTVIQALGLAVGLLFVYFIQFWYNTMYYVVKESIAADG